MIMPRGQQLLLPANPLFVWGSLVATLLLTMLPLGPLPWLPDWLAITLVFWSVHQPRRVGIVAAFIFGLLVDVHQAALLGQHAFAYSVLTYCAIAMHRRLLWFPPHQQAVQILPLFVATHVIVLLVRLLTGEQEPVLSWSAVLAPLLEALLWPVFSALLLAPQRRAPDPDANRPL